MKIGEFSRTYHMNPSAIRYYIEKALLTPAKSNGQYIFDDRCCQQMERIQKYKGYHLSLEEIELLFYYESLSKLKDPDVVRKMLEILEHKRGGIESEIQNLEHVRKDLGQEILELRQIGHALGDRSAPRNTRNVSARVPLSALDLLVCPDCGSQLCLSGAEIDSLGLREGSLHCSCGMEMRIRDGILFCDGAAKDSPFKAFENVNSVLAATDDFSPAYRTLIEKGHLWIYQQIIRLEPSPRAIMAGPFSYNFLLKHLGSLPQDAIFIIVDPSIQKILKLTEYFSEISRHVLYLAGDIRRVPLRSGVIDLYIDDFCSNNYSFTYSKNLMLLIAPFLCPSGHIIGHFVDYTKAPKSLRNFRQDHPQFQPDCMSLTRTRANYAQAGLKLLEENNLGIPEGNQQDFVRQVDGEKVSLITYIAGFLA